MDKVDVAVLVALEEEYQTLRRTLAISPLRSVERSHYFEIQVGDPASAPIRVFVYVIGEMGLVPTVSATNAILDKVEPGWLVSLGLSGQLNSDCALGDVIVATDCDLAYSEARLSADQIEFAGKAFEVPSLKPFLSSIDLSKFLQGRELQITSPARRMLEERRLWRKYPLVHSGLVCSTDFVVDNPKKKAELLTKNRRFLCTDMESAAMISAARKRSYAGQTAIIRAISDPADGTKKEIDRLAGSGTIRQYAMRNAATFWWHSVMSACQPSSGNPRNRPLIEEAIDRLSVVNDLLDGKKESPNDVISQLDSDARWKAKDTELAKYVYRTKISRTPSEVPKPLWEKVQSDGATSAVNFYVALHVMRSLGGNFEALPELLTPLTHVHTYEVNQFCKALLQSASRSGGVSRVLERIRAAYDASTRFDLDAPSKSNLQAHLCYLLGRVTGEQPARTARETLERWRDRLVAAGADKKRSSASKRQLGFSVVELERLTREQLLQFRTIQISLVQLDTPSESDRYILSCLASARLDAQNRGFHLEYYGDIAYDPAQPLSNEDKLGPCPKTLDTLGGKLIRAFASATPYPLRDIELYTVISLLRSRLQHGVLANSGRTRGLEILACAEWMSANDTLSMLLDRVVADLKDPNFHPSGILAEIFRLKKMPRAGWTARGRKVSTPESVGSHTFGGLVLIELFLPETKSREGREMGSGYSKEIVHRLFLKHDWAEAVIGDLLPDQKNEEAEAREEAAFRKLGPSFIYSPYVNDKIYDDWMEFERGDSINAKLARDVDQLDNLQQLLIESVTPDSVIPDRTAWIEYIEARVRTQWGRGMLGFLLRKG